MDNKINSKFPAFGIHNIAKYGKKHLNIKPGEWYGPHMISIVFREICNNEKPIGNLYIHVCQDGNVFFDQIYDLLKNNQSVFVLIPVKLGIKSI